MRQYILVAVTLAMLANIASCRVISKREVASAIDPAKQIDFDDQYRDKRAVDVGIGVKNAILGFVFNKINSFIDQKTQWVDQLDRTNIAKNRIHGIEAPKDAVTTLSEVISNSIGQKLQAAGPILSVVTSKLSGGSSGHGHTGFNFGALLGGSSGHASGGGATAQQYAAI